MRFSSRLPQSWRKLDAPRIVAVAVVVVGHCALVLLLRDAMRTSDLIRESATPGENVLTLEFFPRDVNVPIVMLPRELRPRAQRDSSPRKIAKTDGVSTSAVFLDAAQTVAQPERGYAPNHAASDAFDPPPAHKPFPKAPLFASNLPSSIIRLPDRPSMLQAYWAVPEGENLQGKFARKVPLLGLLLVATGAIGGPICPPKSEHPECLQRLIDGKTP